MWMNPEMVVISTNATPKKPSGLAIWRNFVQNIVCISPTKAVKNTRPAMRYLSLGFSGYRSYESNR